MLVILGIYFMILIVLCFYTYTIGHSKGKLEGVQEERSKYKDHVEVVQKETVVG